MRMPAGLSIGLVCVVMSSGCGGNSTESAEAPDQSVATSSETPSSTTTTIDREAVNAQVDDAVQVACDRAVADPDLTYSEVQPSPSPEWTALGISQADVIQRIKDCAEPLRETAAAEAAAQAAAAEQAAIDSAAPADVDAIVKNPDAVKGQYFTLTAEVTQMDAATGPCMFRGNWDRHMRQYSFEYEGDNAMFTPEDGVTSATDCPILDPLDQDDVVDLTVLGLGSYSYDTQIGGNTTVPLFKVVHVGTVAKR